jgi:hypothetical protein
MATVGGLIWLTLLVCALMNLFQLSIFDLLFLLAPLVVVPLTLSLVPAVQDSSPFGISVRVIRYLLLPGVILTAASFLPPVRRVAVVPNSAGSANCVVLWPARSWPARAGFPGWTKTQAGGGRSDGDWRMWDRGRNIPEQAGGRRQDWRTNVVGGEHLRDFRDGAGRSLGCRRVSPPCFRQSRTNGALPRCPQLRRIRFVLACGLDFVAAQHKARSGANVRGTVLTEPASPSNATVHAQSSRQNWIGWAGPSSFVSCWRSRPERSCSPGCLCGCLQLRSLQAVSGRRGGKLVRPVEFQGIGNATLPILRFDPAWMHASSLMIQPGSIQFPQANG